METRFPISRESGQVHISFVWYDAFRHSKKTEQCSIHFEKAAVLFNLAAVLTQQALNADRATDAGRKEAARFFQVSYAHGAAPTPIILFHAQWTSALSASACWDTPAWRSPSGPWKDTKSSHA